MTSAADPQLEIMVRGLPYRCLAPIRTWRTTGLHFLTRTRRETRWVVNHWTAAENAAPRVYANMAAGRVSVHFIVDQLGEVYQCCDTDARCAHAADNGGNTYGVGIEIVNRGDGDAPARTFVRSTRTERIHGRGCTYAEFFPAQIASVVALNAAICSAYGLPMRVPMKDGDVYPTALPVRYLESFRGVLGHFHLTTGKRDPGLELLRRIHATGVAVG